MEIGGKRLFSHLNHNFAGGQRIGVFGRNGLGKTTLMRIIMGQVEPTEGTAKIGQLTRFNYVDQGRVQLNEERTVLDEISDGSEFVIFGDERLSLRAYLKRFLFTDDRITSVVKHLSGGERSRLLLARILKNGGNFLVLDEPTNDLDLATLRVLEEALVAFPGVVLLLVTTVISSIACAPEFLLLKEMGRVVYSEGNYDYYVEKQQRLLRQCSSFPSRQSARSQIRKLYAKARQALFQRSTRTRRDGGRDSRGGRTHQRNRIVFADPDFHRKYGQQTDELTIELAAQKEKLASLFARWEDLEAFERPRHPPKKRKLFRSQGVFLFAHW
jgi:ATP-binding cassette subfamily F protein uup